MTLWSGRFDTAPDPAAFDFGISFGFDRALFEDDVTGSLAWAEALGSAGVLSKDDVAAIEGALQRHPRAGRSATRRSWPGPTRTCTASSSGSWSSASATPAAGCTPAGRATSRCRWICACICSRRIPPLQRAVATLVAACADRAEAAGDALMPSYTHLRRAQPVLVAHFFLSHAAALRRDHARLAAAADEADALTLGSGAVAGTSYAVDTRALAARLGFSRVVANSIDASSDRDFVASFLYAVSLTMVHLSRLSEDFIIFTGEEHGFFELSDASATGSSMMPQKKNPDPLELVRGKTGRAVGRLTGWLVTMKGLPTGYNKDLQEDKEAVFDAEATLAASLRAAHAVVSRLGVNAERSGRAASGLLLATDVADYLTLRGMPFRTGARSGGRDGAAAAGRGPRFRGPDAGGMARRPASSLGPMRRRLRRHVHRWAPSRRRNPPVPRPWRPHWPNAAAGPRPRLSSR